MEDPIHSAFKDAGLRYTRQRHLIVDILRQSDEHLDAQALFQRAVEKDPDVSLATVYRTLSVLKELGLVEQRHLCEERSQYEPIGEKPHHHFNCVRCGRIVEFDTDLVDRIAEDLHTRIGAVVTRAHVLATGYCAACQTKQRNNDHNGE
jgi:Fur family ferric uptake transcriptional regulator